MKSMTKISCMLLISFAAIWLITCSTQERVTSVQNETNLETEAAYVEEESDYYEASYLQYNDNIYKKSIRTVQFNTKDIPTSEPILSLLGGSPLVLRFDDLDGGLKNFIYEIVHCDSDWNPTNLSTTEYLTGYSEDKISDYRFSFNTLQEYTHYSLQFPNRNMGVKISGNFLLKIYEDYNPEDLVLTKRFLVVNPKIDISAYTHRATLVDDRAAKQEVDFNIDLKDLLVPNPFGDIKVTLVQNSDWQNAITDLKPLFVNGQVLKYDYEKENTFEGGNEYRYFDISSVRFMGENIQKITPTDTGYFVKLRNDKPRSYLQYFSDSDINGKYLIRFNEGKDPDVESDYVHVKFTLLYDDLMDDGDIYIFGQLTNWQILEEAKMRHNEAERIYEGSLYLKQGYYNFAYVFVGDNGIIPNLGRIEGNHYETENQYTILVYHKSLQKPYQELIGLSFSNPVKGY